MRWLNYLLGVIDRTQQILKTKIYGRLKIGIVGYIPQGAGMSSSAALCCGFAYGLNKALNLKISKEDICLIAQWSEHNYIGAKCGLLDQTAIVFSPGNAFMKVDFLTNHREIEEVPFDFSIILIDSNDPHCLAETHYNKRREECKKAADFIFSLVGKEITPESSLRDCLIGELEMSYKVGHMDPILHNRAKYVIEENQRAQ